MHLLQLHMKIKINILHCGYVTVDRSLAFREKSLNPISHTGIFRSHTRQITLPVSSYLIDHPKGLVLVDTGWHTDVRANQKEHLGILSHFFRASLPPGPAIHEQLAVLGISPGDIDFVLLSHMHADHASGLSLVKNAKNILASRSEWEDTVSLSTRFNYARSMWKDIRIEKFHFEESGYGPRNQSYDLFNDNSMLLVSTPGHTNGLFSTLIQNNNQFVLLCSDVAYAKKSWHEPTLPGVMVSRKDTMASLNWVKHMSKLDSCLGVLANHDPDVTPHQFTF